MNWFKKLFGKKEEAAKPSPNLLSFNIISDRLMDDADRQTEYGNNYVGVEIRNKEGFLDFIRNYEDSLNISDYSDQELAHLFIYLYTQRWLMDNMKKPMFIETHTFPAHGEIKYDRAWNKAFVGAVTNLGLDVLPPTEGELMEMYMNYIYGTRLMAEMEAMEAANPTSIAHPELSNPSNTFKG